MKYRFYITDLYNGVIKGTDDEALARTLAQVEDYFVVDTQTGEWLAVGEDSPIEEFKRGGA